MKNSADLFDLGRCYPLRLKAEAEVDNTLLDLQNSVNINLFGSINQRLYFSSNLMIAKLLISPKKINYKIIKVINK